MIAVTQLPTATAAPKRSFGATHGKETAMRDWRDDAQAELEELRRLLAHANELSGIQPYVIAHISERTPGTLTPDITAWDLISFVRGMLYVISDTDTQSVEDDDPIIQQLWRLDATIPDDGSLK